MKKYLGAMVMVLSLMGALTVTMAVGAEKEKASAPEGWVLVEESVVMDLSEAALEHFQAARELYLKGDLKGSAAQIKDASALLKLEANRAQGDLKKQMMEHARNLDMMAGQVAAGAVKSVEQLDRDFVYAQVLLAHHHLMKASEFLSVQKIPEAGKDLGRSGAYLETGLTWAGKKMDQTYHEAITEAKDLSKKIQNGEKVSAEQLKATIDKLKNKIEEYDKIITPK